MEQCLWCDEPFHRLGWAHILGLEQPDRLCSTCRDQLEPITLPICDICGRSLNDLDDAYVHGSRCYDCVRWENSPWQGMLTANHSLYQYNSYLQAAIARWKYRGDAVMMEAFASEFVTLFKKHFPHDLIVPIPLSHQRLYERGFNQAGLLASMLPGDICEALARTQHQEKQSKQGRDTRLAVAHNPFTLTDEATSLVGKKVVIIDDIYTTGATVRRAAIKLKEAGAVAVCSLTLARG